MILGTFWWFFAIVLGCSWVLFRVFEIWGEEIGKLVSFWGVLGVFGVLWGVFSGSFSVSVFGSLRSAQRRLKKGVFTVFFCLLRRVADERKESKGQTEVSNSRACPLFVTARFVEHSGARSRG